MSTNEWDFDDDEFDEQPEKKSAPKALREAYKAEKERAKQLEDALAKVQRDLRQRTVRDVLVEKGVNPKLARFVLNDLDEVDEGSVAKWLDENGELFGVTVEQQEEGDNQEANEYERAAAARGSSPSPDGDALAKIQAASSQKELNDALVAAGLA